MYKAQYTILKNKKLEELSRIYFRSPFQTFGSEKKNINLYFLL